MLAFALIVLLKLGHASRAALLSARHVQQVKDSLERRIRERTEELSGKNDELAGEVQERRRAERELLDARLAAESSSRSKSEFLANMSHEIRTPMTSILGYAERLSDAELHETERHDAIETIRRNGEYLLQLINDILDLSKIEAGKLALEEIPCSPARIVLDVQSAMELRALAKGLQLRVDFSEHLPQRVVTDPTRLKQVLMNLLGNAIKFTQRGEVRLQVEFAPPGPRGPRNAQLVFTVTDTGIGMDEAQLKHLFRPFTQADNSTARRFGGTGLGLSICRTLVERMGGDIQVRSQAGQGSSFTFRIDTGSLEGVDLVSEGEILRLRDRLDAERLRESGVRLECRVLVAEDGEDNQRLLLYYLRKAGAEVVLAVDGHQAVDRALEAQAEGRPFDIVIMDMQMPRLDGYGATSRLRAAGYKLPIVALTANAMAHDRRRCLDAGCDDFCTKPIDKYRFLSIVARWARPAPPAPQPSGGVLPAAPAATDTRGLPRNAPTSSIPSWTSSCGCSWPT
jgi:signal transduction histidine kinase